MTHEGLPVNFTVTTETDRTTLDEEPKGFYCGSATDHTTWDASEFITAKQWLARQTPAKEAEAEAEQHERGHVADQHPAHDSKQRMDMVQTIRKHTKSNQRRDIMRNNQKERRQRKDKDKDTFGRYPCPDHIGPRRAP